jgi:DMSO/TMAO reductase YedYZ molybdopterin-dependent catalytic subunit
MNLKKGNIMGKELSRRFFLKAMGIMAFLFTLPGKGWSLFLDQFETRTVEKDSFIFDPETGMVRWQGKGREAFQLLVDGLVETPRQFSYKDLKGFPHITQTSDFHCVEGWSVKDVRWGGFRFQEILKRVKTKPGADYVIFHSLGETSFQPQGQKNYIESYPLQKLMDAKEEILLAFEIEGKPLSHDRGAPLRLVAPYDLAYKNIKFVTRIEFSSKPQPGWWTLANPIYPIDAPVSTDRLRKKKS